MVDLLWVECCVLLSWIESQGQTIIRPPQALRITSEPGVGTQGQLQIQAKGHYMKEELRQAHMQVTDWAHWQFLSVEGSGRQLRGSGRR